MTDLQAKIEEKLQVLEMQRESYIAKVKQAVDDNHMMQLSEPAQEGELLAYFSHSCNLAVQDGQDHIILGSLMIHNSTTKPIEQLSISIMIETESVYQFSGKYVMGKGNKQKQSLPINWERITEVDDKHTYWFKWIGDQPIAPFSKVKFADFTISMQNEGHFYCKVNGFLYTPKKIKGMQVGNVISVQMN